MDNNIWMDTIYIASKPATNYKISALCMHVFDNTSNIQIICKEEQESKNQSKGYLPLLGSQ